MSRFTTPLVVSPHRNGRTWTVWEDFAYYFDDKDGPGITVPAGFMTDFASVPRIFWWLISPYGKHGKAAVLHDFLYYMARNGTGKPRTRKEADVVFLQAMKVLGVATWKRLAMYYAVRIGARRAWVRF